MPVIKSRSLVTIVPLLLWSRVAKTYTHFIRSLYSKISIINNANKYNNFIERNLHNTNCTIIIKIISMIIMNH